MHLSDWKNRKDPGCLFENIDEEYLNADLLLSVDKLPDFVTPWEGPCNFTYTKAPCFPEFNITKYNFGKIILPKELQNEFQVRIIPLIYNLIYSIRWQWCWWHRYVGRSPTYQSFHQHIWSPTSVTYIDVTKNSVPKGLLLRYENSL